MNVDESALLAEAALAAAQAVGEEHLSPPLGANVGAQEGVGGGNEGGSSNNGAAGVKRGNEQIITVGEGDSNNNPAKKLKVGEMERENENDNSNVVTANIIQASKKKDRTEYTASEKLHFLSLLGNNNVEGGPNPPADGDDEQPQQPLTAKQLCEKYQVSKSSLHRWKQQRSRLEELVAEEGLGDRKRYTKDLLLKVKTELKTFVEENSAKCPESRLEITTQVLMTQAEIIRVGLLELHESRSKEDKSKKEDTANKEGRLEEAETAVVLTEEEYKALKSFKVTKSWAGRVATSLGLLKSPRGERKPRKKVAEEVTAAEGVAISSPEQAKQNTLHFLSEFKPAPTTTTPKPKKQRREFTALEKLDILRELENGANMQQICASKKVDICS